MIVEKVNELTFLGTVALESLFDVSRRIALTSSGFGWCKEKI